MIFLFVLLALLGLLALVALLPLGVSVRFEDEGFFLAAHAGPVKLTLFPRPEKAEKQKKSRQPKKEKKPKKESEEKPKEPSPRLQPTLGGLVELLEGVIPALADTLDRLRRKLTVEELTVYYTSAAADPYYAAMHYGKMSAVLEGGLPTFQRWFRVKKCDTAVSVSFDGEGDRLYFAAKLSLRIWELIYIALGMYPALKALVTFMRTSRGGKAEENGKASHQ
ncbi:MAG: hypothetical protein ACSW8F_06850 [bacterium]